MKGKKVKEVKEPETEYGRFLQMLDAYEMILHPNVWNPLMFQLHKVREEALVEAYKQAKISDEALAIEKIIKEMREYARINPDGMPALFNYKIAFKRILQIFKDKV